MRILLTGSTGQLGTSLKNNVPDHIDLLSFSKKELDLVNQRDCREIIKEIKPDWVINAAAYTQVDNAEIEKEESLSINGNAPKIFAEELLKTGGKIIQLSTDYVFNGEQNKPYKGNQKRDPVNHYGFTKLFGEKAVENILGKSNQGIILRTSWLMSPFGNNFVKTLVRLLSERDEISVVSDQIGCFTSTKTLSKACWLIIDKFSSRNSSRFPHILHWADEGITSWYQIAKSIQRFGLELGILRQQKKILPIQSIKYPTKAKRPLYSVLDCKNTYKLLDTKPKHWEQSLYEIMETLSKN